MAADVKALAELLPGRSYRLPQPYEVSAEKIREFAAAIGETEPAFYSAQAAARRGFRGVIAPPTFPIVITFKVLQQLLADPELAVDLRRVMHGDQRFVAVRPLCAGDVLECTTSVETVRRLGDSLMVGTRSELREIGAAALEAQTLDVEPRDAGALDAGSPVVTAHATLLIGIQTI